MANLIESHPWLSTFIGLLLFVIIVYLGNRVEKAQIKNQLNSYDWKNYRRTERGDNQPKY